jgi:hypothetical protein
MANLGGHLELQGGRAMNAFIFGSALEMAAGLTIMLALWVAMVLSKLRGVH